MSARVKLGFMNGAPSFAALRSLRLPRRTDYEICEFLCRDARRARKEKRREGPISNWSVSTREDSMFAVVQTIPFSRHHGDGLDLEGDGGFVPAVSGVSKTT